MLERNAQIVAMARQEPVPTLQEIGDKFGLTRERVRRILAKRNVTKPSRRIPIKQRPCKFIGCQNYHTAKRHRYCDEHAYDSHNGRKTLSHQFRVLTCSKCGTKYQRSEHFMKTTGLRNGKPIGTFCSRECFGGYVAKHFGWQPRPEWQWARDLQPGLTYRVKNHKHSRSGVRTTCKLQVLILALFKRYDKSATTKHDGPDLLVTRLV